MRQRRADLDDARNPAGELRQQVGVGLRGDLALDRHDAVLDGHLDVGRVEPHHPADHVVLDLLQDLLVGADERAHEVSAADEPDSVPSASTTGRRLTFSSSISVAASATVRSARIVRAGDDIASPTVTASKRAATQGSPGSTSHCRKPPRLLLVALLGEDVRLRDDADHVAVAVDDRHAGDSAAGRARSPRPSASASGVVVATSVVITSCTLMTASRSGFRTDRRAGAADGASGRARIALRCSRGGVFRGRSAAERAERVEDHRHVDDLLEQRAPDGRQVAERGHAHRGDGQPEAVRDALARDVERPPADQHRQGDPARVVRP